jgi:hypothetical protein
MAVFLDPLLQLLKKGKRVFNQGAKVQQINGISGQPGFLSCTPAAKHYPGLFV